MNRSIQRLTIVALLCVCVITAALAEDPPTKKKEGQADLTEGLMDLLREPAKSQTAPAPADQPVPTKQPPPIDGEDIGQGPANPLAEVQLGMTTLAQWMRSRPDVARTKQLQRDVVLRLDELIGQLEQQSPSPSQSAASSSSTSSTSESSQSSQTQSQASSSADPQASANGVNPTQSPKGQRPNNSPSQQTADGKSGQDTESQNPSSRPPQPGQSGGGNNPQPGQPGASAMGSRNVTVDLNDPRALQRSAWGNLPERTREQMQSRMVERFLPPYRDEIEAYYRALAK